MTTLDHRSLELLKDALETLDSGFDRLPEFAPGCDMEAVRSVLGELAGRLRDNYPYQHPLYAGQMLKPPHAVARLGYALAMFLNPNNHALDGGRASSAMEKESVADIGRMFGWPECLGHLCGGGTLANFEALWVARELAPGRAVAASDQAHYTHSRLSAVLGVPFLPISSDARGRLDVDDLERRLGEGTVGTVVATLGTTAAGAVDPLPRILELRQRFDFRIHVDTAYGGYFTLADNLDGDARGAFDAIERADSVVVDPHKHGLQPYGCGCVLFRDPSVGRFYRHDSPYTYFTSDELHLGEISLECSRAGASAAALWATMRLLPLQRGGEFAGMLGDCRGAALELHRILADSAAFRPLFEPQLDIVVWAVRADSASRSSRAAQRVFEAAAEHELHLALASFPRHMVEPCGAIDCFDEERVLCLRACMMKPEHRQWMAEIAGRLERAAAALEPESGSEA